MDIALPEKIDREEWLKFLHVTGEPDEDLQLQMDKAEKDLLRAASPRGIYRVLDRDLIATEGVSVEKHLEGCDRVSVLAVTIGAGIDQLITRTQLTSMAMAVVLDAGASVLAEQVADAAERVMKSQLAGSFPGTFTTPRFSPGYGDYPVHCQREILRYTDAPRKIGVTLTDGDMMVPHKSVTALVGIADHPVAGRLAPCSECVLRAKCDFLKEGRHC